jgi:hypothetical protein
MTPLRWTREAPKEAHVGCYFWREDVEDPGDPEIVYVYVGYASRSRPHALMVRGTRSTIVVESDTTSLWAGPIAPPEEA